MFEAAENEIQGLKARMNNDGLHPAYINPMNGMRQYTNTIDNDGSCWYFIGYLSIGIKNILVASYGSWSKELHNNYCSVELFGEDLRRYDSKTKEQTMYINEWEKSYRKEKLSNNDVDVDVDVEKDTTAQSNSTNDLLNNELMKDIVSINTTNNVEYIDKKYEGKDGFVFYKGFDKARKFLSDSEQLSYLNSIIDYGLYGKTINASPMVQGMLELIKPNLDANYKNWKNSKKGGRPRKVNN
jgi:hypothetical protein